MRRSERRLSSVAYRNQASGFTGNPLGLDTSLRSYSAGAGRKVSGSKAYYTMFYAAKAVLLLEGINVRKHRGATSYFGQKFVKAGRVDRRYGRLLQKAMEDRETADYDPEVRATHEQAGEAIANAEEFLLKAKELFAENIRQPEEH